MRKISLFWFRVVLLILVCCDWYGQFCVAEVNWLKFVSEGLWGDGREMVSPQI